GAPAVRSAARLEQPVFIVSPPRSGSTLLFETLLAAPGVHTIGDESHALIVGIPGLAPSAHGFDSNRLLARDATPEAAAALRRRFLEAARDRDGRTPVGEAVRRLEKTPKNALRIPFLKAAFPDARFIYLHRDPRQVLASMIEGWASGNFVMYPQLPGWPGPAWSFLLTPGWPASRWPTSSPGNGRAPPACCWTTWPRCRARTGPASITTASSPLRRTPPAAWRSGPAGAGTANWDRACRCRAT